MNRRLRPPPRSRTPPPDDKAGRQTARFGGAWPRLIDRAESAPVLTTPTGALYLFAPYFRDPGVVPVSDGSRRRLCGGNGDFGFAVDQGLRQRRRRRPRELRGRQGADRWILGAQRGREVDDAAHADLLH